jgi:hypothetical protein
MSHAGCLDYPDLLEREVRADAVEESRPASEHQRDDVELVDERRSRPSRL